MIFGKKMLLCVMALSGFESLMALRGGDDGSRGKKNITGSAWGTPLRVAYWTNVSNVPLLTFINPTQQPVNMTYVVTASANPATVLTSGSITVPPKRGRSTFRHVNFPKILSRLSNRSKQPFSRYDITITVARSGNYDSSGNDFRVTVVPSVPTGSNDDTFISLFYSTAPLAY